MSDITAKIISIDTDEAKNAVQENLVRQPPADSVTQRVEASTSAAHSAPAAAKTGSIWVMASLLALCWLLLVGAIFGLQYGFSYNMTTVTPVEWAGIAALAAFPVLIILLCGFALSKLANLTLQSRALTAAADAISKPDAAMEARAASLAGAVRSQILNVESSLEASLQRLASMELTLKGHTDALANSHIAATRQTGEIAQRLTQERDGLQSISKNFDERMGALSRMMNEHGERLTQSTHVAEQKIQEARVSVEGAAAKINASSEIVRDNALEATQSLAVTEQSISELALKIKAQANAIDTINSRHAAEMSDLVGQLKAEQEEMNATIEDRLDKMRDMSLSARVSAEQLADASEAGRQTVEALAQSASLADSAVKQRFADMEDMVEYSTAKAESIGERAAKRVRDSLSLTRMEIGRIEQDMLALENHVPAQNRTRTKIYDITETQSKPASKTGWRKSLLRFRPLDEDVAVPIAAPALNISSTNADAAPLNTSLPSEAAEQSSAGDIPPKVSANLDPELSAPALDLTSQASPLTSEASPIIDNMAEADLSLDFDVDPEPPLNDTFSEFDAPISRIEDTPPLRKSSKRNWSWRSMLGGIDSLSSESENDLASSNATGAPLDLQALGHYITQELKQIGLAPNAVVDDGCIIECVNTGKAKGPSAMKDVVSLRLSSPVRHLSETLEVNIALSSQVRSFVEGYHKALESYSDDREGLRSQLETETGRAFLLCDAAQRHGLTHLPDSSSELSY